MYDSIVRFCRLIFNMPSLLCIFIIFLIEIVKIYKKQGFYDNLEDNKEMVDSLIKHIYIDFERYQGHVNWITWITFALLILK